MIFSETRVITFFDTRPYNVTPIHFTSPMTTAFRGQGTGSQAG